MARLAGKRALVTGGSSGIGAAVVKLLVQQGARVAINYSSNQQRAAQVLDDVGGTDKGHLLIRANAFVKAEIDSMVQEAVQHFGGLDLVVSNAGWTAFGEFSDLNAITDDDWINCYQNNVLSHLWLMQRCEAELKKAEGSFVVSASVAGLKPSGSSMAYSVSKAATIHLVRSMAVALSPKVRVNCVAAGVMLTDWSKGFTEAQRALVTKSNALGKLTEVEDVAGIYVSLLENQSMTGQCIEVSAGFRLQ